jgi:cell division protein ZapA
MREIRESSKVIGAERIAIMAGLNLAHELLTQGGGGQTEETRARLTHCSALLDSVLEDQDKLF